MAVTNATPIFWTFFPFSAHPMQWSVIIFVRKIKNVDNAEKGHETEKLSFELRMLNKTVTDALNPQSNRHTPTFPSALTWPGPPSP